MKPITENTEWQALANHYHDIANLHMRDLFAKDTRRFSRYTLLFNDILLDYSRNRITDQTISMLCHLAESQGLKGKIEALFAGHPINVSENRPALHTALRDLKHSPIYVNGEDIAGLIAESRDKMRTFVTRVHTGQWKGITGKPISHIVNIGIGGSFQGPMMCCHALKEFAVANLKIHFISTVDDIHLNEIWQQIDPESTLFIISSKSFTTIETLTNTHTIAARMKARFGQDVLRHHFIAVTSEPEKAISFGIPAEQVFPLWSWIGGRYSVWSAIGLPLMLLIGNEQFSQFLAGAHEMDEHFRHKNFAENMPVLLAMLTVWYMNFFDSTVQAIIPYSHRLRYLVPYLQQAEMESNGKSVNLGGNDIQYATGPVLLGDAGCSGQHTYHQLLNQGRHLIPVDFIIADVKTESEAGHHQDILLASCLSQAQALMRGKTYEEAYHDLIARHYSQKNAADLARHQMIPGNKPSNIIVLKRITPKSLGALIALYEHKIFVQGVIWNINPFDQWGVELGKQLLPAILNSITRDQEDAETDPATAGLIEYLRQLKRHS